MATSKEYRDFVLEKLDLLDDIVCKPMMGEYLLYYKNILFGGIYDERILIKKTETNSDFGLEDAIPYKGAKPMYLIDIEDKEMIRNIVLETSKGLPIKQKKKGKK